MAADEIGDETAGRHDPEAATAGVVQRLAHQLRADALALVDARHFGMGEQQPVALAVIDRDRKPVRRVELVAALRLVVPRGRHAVLAVTSADAPRARGARTPRSGRNRDAARRTDRPP